MAKQRSFPPASPGKDSFLGGGVQFNKVGTSIPGASSLPPDDAPAAPARTRAQARRTLAIVAALVLLVALLAVFSSDSISGIRHTPGRGGISASSHTPAPPRNF